MSENTDKQDSKDPRKALIRSLSAIGTGLLMLVTTLLYAYCPPSVPVPAGNPGDKPADLPAETTSGATSDGSDAASSSTSAGSGPTG